MKIIIVGGGASGLLAATIAKNSHNEVTILEANNDIGKKILVTGNGRCNYWHEGITPSNYYTDDEEHLKAILMRKDETLDYLNTLGLVPTIKEGYYYPMSNQASSVRDMFKYQISKRGIDVITGFKVTSIKKENNIYVISDGIHHITCDKVIISCGSIASKKGANEKDNILFKSLGHQINPLLPALVPIIIEDAKKYNWAGIRTHANLTLVSNYKVLKEESGELQLTSSGLSGICTLNLSSIVSRELKKHNDVSIYLNFMPNIANVEEYLDKRSKMLNNPSINELLNSLINYKLIGIITNLLRIKTDTPYEELSKKEKAWLINNITNFECKVIGTEGYERSQVCTGGELLSEINPETMESKIVNGLYIIGEALDVDGECGGYNLAFAFTSGFIAGKSVSYD